MIYQFQPNSMFHVKKKHYIQTQVLWCTFSNSCRLDKLQSRDKSENNQQRGKHTIAKRTQCFTLIVLNSTVVTCRGDKILG